MAKKKAKKKASSKKAASTAPESAPKAPFDPLGIKSLSEHAEGCLYNDPSIRLCNCK